MTSKRLDVGYSEKRSPVKHAVESGLLGQEIGVISSLTGRLRRNRCLWIDLAAGNGAAHGGRPWDKSCSPGIMARHAEWGKATISVTVILQERDPGVYGELVGNLSVYLPERGWERHDEFTWWRPGAAGPCYLAAWCADSLVMDIGRVVHPRDAVFVANDGNSPEDWAMRPGLIDDIAWILEPWPCVRSFSSFIPNAGPLKLLPLSRREEKWGSHLEDLARTLPFHQDLLLVRMTGDPAQSAYLMSVPLRWLERMPGQVEKEFRRHDKSLQMAWLRQDPEGFRVLRDQLIYRKSELSHD